MINKAAGCLSIVLSMTMVLPPSYAQPLSAVSAVTLPKPGVMAMSSAYAPAIINGMTLNPQDPFQFDFIIERGDDRLQGDSFKQESEKLIRYFFAALTVPEEEMWVNLSPYEEDRIVSDGLASTVLGRDMLAQDYLLKQITSSLMHPEGEVGKQFWQRIYDIAFERYGTTEIPVDTFNKVWIVPEEAHVVVRDESVFVTKRHLKVMLERDYVAAQRHKVIQSYSHKKNNADHEVTKKNGGVFYDLMTVKNDKDDLSSDIIRKVILPALEREVNEGQHFANLRQIYNAMILATWYKKKFKQSILNKLYADQNKVDGIDDVDLSVRDDIWQQYVRMFKEGVYDFIAEQGQTSNVMRQKNTRHSEGALATEESHGDPSPTAQDDDRMTYDPMTYDSEGDAVTRRYFAGGLIHAPHVTEDGAMTADWLRDQSQKDLAVVSTRADKIKQNDVVMETTDAALVTVSGGEYNYPNFNVEEDLRRYYDSLMKKSKRYEETLAWTEFSKGVDILSRYIYREPSLLKDIVALNESYFYQEVKAYWESVHVEQSYMTQVEFATLLNTLSKEDLRQHPELIVVYFVNQEYPDFQIVTYARKKNVLVEESVLKLKEQFKKEFDDALGWAKQQLFGDGNDGIIRRQKRIYAYLKIKEEQAQEQRASLIKARDLKKIVHRMEGEFKKTAPGNMIEKLDVSLNDKIEALFVVLIYDLSSGQGVTLEGVYNSIVAYAYSEDAIRRHFFEKEENFSAILGALDQIVNDRFGDLQKESRLLDRLLKPAGVTGAEIIPKKVSVRLQKIRQEVKSLLAQTDSEESGNQNVLNFRYMGFEGGYRGHAGEDCTKCVENQAFSALDPANHYYAIERDGKIYGYVGLTEAKIADDDTLRVLTVDTIQLPPDAQVSSRFIPIILNELEKIAKAKGFLGIALPGEEYIRDSFNYEQIREAVKKLSRYKNGKKMFLTPRYESISDKIREEFNVYPSHSIEEGLFVFYFDLDDMTEKKIHDAHTAYLNRVKKQILDVTETIDDGYYEISVVAEKAIEVESFIDEEKEDGEKSIYDVYVLVMSFLVTPAQKMYEDLFQRKFMDSDLGASELKLLHLLLDELHEAFAGYEYTEKERDLNKLLERIESRIASDVDEFDYESYSASLYDFQYESAFSHVFEEILTRIEWQNKQLIYAFLGMLLRQSREGLQKHILNIINSNKSEYGGFFVPASRGEEPESDDFEKNDEYGLYGVMYDQLEVDIDFIMNTLERLGEVAQKKAEQLLVDFKREHEVELWPQDNAMMSVDRVSAMGSRDTTVVTPFTPKKLTSQQKKLSLAVFGSAEDIKAKLTPKGIDDDHWANMLYEYMDSIYKRLRVTDQYTDDESYPNTTRDEFRKQLLADTQTSPEQIESTLENHWFYRHLSPDPDLNIVHRGSLNIALNEDVIREIDALITKGIFRGEYKIADPQTVTANRHDSVTLFFYEEITPEVKEAFSDIAQRYYRGHSLLGERIVDGFSTFPFGSISTAHVEDLFKLFMVINPKAGRYLRRMFYDPAVHRQYGMSEGSFYALQEVLADIGLTLVYDSDQGFSLLKGKQLIDAKYIQSFGIEPEPSLKEIELSPQTQVLPGDRISLSLSTRRTHQFNLSYSDKKYQVYITRSNFGNHVITIVKNGKAIKRFVDAGEDYHFDDFWIRSEKDGVALEIISGDAVLQEGVLLVLPESDVKQEFVFHTGSDDVTFEFWSSREGEISFKRAYDSVRTVGLGKTQEGIYGSVHIDVRMNFPKWFSVTNKNTTSVRVEIKDGAMATKQETLDTAIDKLRVEHPELDLELAALYLPIEELQGGFWNKMDEMSAVMGKDVDVVYTSVADGQRAAMSEISRRLGLTQSAVSHMFKKESTSLETQQKLTEVYIDYFDLERNATRWKSIEWNLEEARRIAVMAREEMSMKQLSVRTGLSVKDLNRFIDDHKVLSVEKTEKLIRFLIDHNAHDDAKLLRNYSEITRFLKQKIRRMTGMIDEYGNPVSGKVAREKIRIISIAELAKRIGVSESGIAHYLKSDAMELTGFDQLLEVMHELGSLTPEEQKMVDDAARWDSVFRGYVEKIKNNTRLPKLSKNTRTPGMLSVSGLVHYINNENARIDPKRVLALTSAVIDEFKLDRVSDNDPLWGVLWWQEQVQHYLQKIDQHEGLGGFAARHHFDEQQLRRWMNGRDGVPIEDRDRLVFALDQRFGISRAASDERRVYDWHKGFVKSLGYVAGVKGVRGSIYHGIVVESTFSRWGKSGIKPNQDHKKEMSERVRSLFNMPESLPEPAPLAYVPDVKKIDNQAITLVPLTPKRMKAEEFSYIREGLGDVKIGYGSYAALDADGKPVGTIVLSNDPDNTYHVAQWQSVYIDERFQNTALPTWLMLKALTDLRLSQPHKARMEMANALSIPQVLKKYIPNPEARLDIYDLTALTELYQQQDAAMVAQDVFAGINGRTIRHSMGGAQERVYTLNVTHQSTDPENAVSVFGVYEDDDNELQFVRIASVVLNGNVILIDGDAQFLYGAVLTDLGALIRETLGDAYTVQFGQADESVAADISAIIAEERQDVMAASYNAFEQGFVQSADFHDWQWEVVTHQGQETRVAFNEQGQWMMRLTRHQGSDVFEVTYRSDYRDQVVAVLQHFGYKFEMYYQDIKQRKTQVSEHKEQFPATSKFRIESFSIYPYTFSDFSVSEDWADKSDSVGADGKGNLEAGFLPLVGMVYQSFAQFLVSQIAEFGSDYDERVLREQMLGGANMPLMDLHDAVSSLDSGLVEEDERSVFIDFEFSNGHTGTVSLGQKGAWVVDGTGKAVNDIMKQGVAEGVVRVKLRLDDNVVGVVTAQISSIDFRVSNTEPYDYETFIFSTPFSDTLQHRIALNVVDVLRQHMGESWVQSVQLLSGDRVEVRTTGGERLEFATYLEQYQLLIMLDDPELRKKYVELISSLLQSALPWTVNVTSSVATYLWNQLDPESTDQQRIKQIVEERFGNEEALGYRLTLIKKIRNITFPNNPNGEPTESDVERWGRFEVALAYSDARVAEFMTHFPEDFFEHEPMVGREGMSVVLLQSAEFLTQTLAWVDLQEAYRQAPEEQINRSVEAQLTPWLKLRNTDERNEIPDHIYEGDPSMQTVVQFWNFLWDNKKLWKKGVVDIVFRQGDRVRYTLPEEKPALVSHHDDGKPAFFPSETHEYKGVGYGYGNVFLNAYKVKEFYVVVDGVPIAHVKDAAMTADPSVPASDDLMIGVVLQDIFGKENFVLRIGMEVNYKKELEVVSVEDKLAHEFEDRESDDDGDTPERELDSRAPIYDDYMRGAIGLDEAATRLFNEFQLPDNTTTPEAIRFVKQFYLPQYPLLKSAKIELIAARLAAKYGESFRRELLVDYLYGRVNRSFFRDLTDQTILDEADMMSVDFKAKNVVEANLDFLRMAFAWRLDYRLNAEHSEVFIQYDPITGQIVHAQPMALDSVYSSFKPTNIKNRVLKQSGEGLVVNLDPDNSVDDDPLPNEIIEAIDLFIKDGMRVYPNNGAVLLPLEDSVESVDFKDKNKPLAAESRKYLWDAADQLGLRSQLEVHIREFENQENLYDEQYLNGLIEADDDKQAHLSRLIEGSTLGTIKEGDGPEEKFGEPDELRRYELSIVTELRFAFRDLEAAFSADNQDDMLNSMAYMLTLLDVVDNAQVVGGIDLNSESLNLRESGDVIEFNVDAAMLNMRPEDLRGIKPVIIHIRPVTNFYQLLGLKKEEAEQILASAA